MEVAEILTVLKSVRPEFTDQFERSADYAADGLLDSFDVVVLVTALEKQFGVSIPGDLITPEHFKNAHTIYVLVAMIKAW